MRTQRTDAGNYNRPAIIKKTATRTDDGLGGDTSGWTIVRGGGNPPLMVSLGSSNFGRGLHLVYKVMQQYPQATHWATFRYASDAIISAGMFLFITVNNVERQYQILGGEDVTLEHVTTILALIEHGAKGSV